MPRTMIVGIDFDNTIVCYDQTFAELARRHEIELKSGISSKRQLASAMRAQPEGEYRWSLLQGEAYGPQLKNASPYPGIAKRIGELLLEGHRIVIISHKTTFPSVGHPYSFRNYAKEWILSHLSDLIEKGLNPGRDVFFAETQQEKVALIASQGCDVFIDDLAEILVHESFPETCVGIHFSEESTFPNHFSDWKTLVLPPVANVVKPSNLPLKTEPDTLKAAEILLSDKAVHSRPAAGGINSDAHLVEFEKKGRLFVKRYPNDSRDRLERESSFLEYTNSVTPGKTATLKKLDSDNRIIILSELVGDSVAATPTVPSSYWEQCHDFLLELQTGRDQANLCPSSEGAASLQEQLGYLTQRRNRWLKMARDRILEANLGEWIQKELETLYQTIARACINQTFYKERLSEKDLIVSPSDFGLHNAIVNNSGEIYFFDFEYAGWDEPSKTLTDFFYQPRIPAPPDLYSKWKHSLFELLPPDRVEAHEKRLPYVSALCQAKWIYIILAHRCDMSASHPNLSASHFSTLRKRVEELSEAACQLT